MTKLLEDWRLAVATIHMEAGGEPQEGRVAVAKVIRNRMRLGYASNGTVSSTVLRPYQFSCWNTDSSLRDRACTLETGDSACEHARLAWIASEDSDVLPDDAVLYHATYVAPPWSRSPKVEFIKRIGAHLFYRDRL